MSLVSMISGSCNIYLMTAFQTILIVGATSGIGEELARQYYSRGKNLIISGRRTARLDTLEAQLPGVSTIQVCNFTALDILSH
jgi:short-subunit dehydrogenase